MFGLPCRYSPPVSAPSGVEESCRFRVQVERRPLAKKALVLPSTTTDGPADTRSAAAARTQLLRFAVIANNIISLTDQKVDGP